MSTMRKRIDKSPAIDAATNLRLVTMIQNHDELYTKEEEEILRNGMAHFSKFEGKIGKELKSASKLITARVAFEAKSSIAIGWATTTVRAR
jgi:hypothetical protein